jgi:hypothetical protein
MRVSRKVALFMGALLSVTIAGCSSTSVAPAAKPSWERVLPPEVSETDEVRVLGSDLEDGTYWANVAPVSGDDDVVFHVTRVRFGQVCERWAAEMLREDACLNDYGVEEYPEAYAGIAPYARVSVAMPGAPGENLLIDAATLRHLVRKDVLVLPAGYEWVPFPFVVSVEAGGITEAHQYWVP